MKHVRIILSPFVFFCVFLFMSIIPIGILCLYIGLIDLTRAFILQEKIEQENIEMTFIWFILPYLETKKFINGT